MNIYTTNRGMHPTKGVAGILASPAFTRLTKTGWPVGRRNLCFVLLLILTIGWIPAAKAQCSGPNLLTNPSFESPVVTANTNNLVASIPGWTNHSIDPTTVNVFRPSGVLTQIPSTPANGSQYIDLQGSLGIMDQTFTLTAPAAIAFSGSFSNRVSSVPGSGYVGGDAFIQILDATATYEIALSSIVTLNAALGDQTWVTASGISSVLPAGTYTFRFAARTDYANFDNMSVCVANNAATSCANRTVLKPQPGWSATASATAAGFSPTGAIDGSTIDGGGWATPANPIGSYITFDYGTSQNLVGFIYYPRTAAAQDIYLYTVQSSNDGINFTTIQSGSIAKQNVINPASAFVLDAGKSIGNPLEVDFTTAVNARYMRLIVNATYQGSYGVINELLPIVCSPPVLNDISCVNANLLNTGTNATGTGIAAIDRLDANWEAAWVPNAGGNYGQPIPISAIANATFVPAVVTGNKVPGTWANSPFGNANWISYTQTSYDASWIDPTAIPGDPNSYFFRYRFNITDPYLLPAFKLTLNFLSDNETQNIYINGVGQAPQFGLPGGGFFLSNQTQTVLKNNWQLGQNEIIVQVFSKPGLAGFLGQNITSCPGLDFGDAPASYNVSRTTSAAGHIVETDPNGVVTLKLGNLIDSEADGVASVTATSDNTSNFNDEDGVSSFPVIQGTNGLSFSNYTVNVALSNNTTTAANLCGWIDWNNNGTFDASESVCVTVAKGATSAQLVWPSATLTGVTGSSTGTFARFRITTDALASNSANGAASNGEVEDYFIPFCIIPPPTATLATPATICSGAPVTINYTTNPTGQTVQWMRMPGGITGVGNLTDFPQATGTTPVSYTYSAWISNAAGSCSSTTVTTGVTVNPVPVITPSVCSQTICSGETGAITFTSSVLATINWLRVEDGSTGTGNISQLFATAGTNTYKIWGVSAAPASCPSSTTITCVIMVNNCCSLTVTASASQTAVCVGQAVTLATSISGNAGAVTYFWTGPNGFTSNAANPTLPAATSATAGIYTVTVSDPTASTSCVKTATVTLNVGSLYVVATSNSPVCTTGSLSLTGIAAGGSGSYTYAWTGPNGFVSAVQNPTLALSTTAQSGNYNLLVTDTQGCSGTATTAVVVATQPNLTVTGSPSQTICSGQSTTLIVAGSNGAPVSWTNSLGQTGTGTTITSGTLVNAGTVPMVVTYRIRASTGSCSDEEIVQVVVKPEPRLQVVPNASIICNLEQTNITATANPATASITWTRTPNTPNPPAASGSGTGSVTINQVLPPATYTYSFTATNGGCSSTLPATVAITVQQ